MNSQPLNQPEPVTSPTESRTAATLEQAEEAFARWMDCELEKLVAQWIHLAAPNATRTRTSRRSRS